MVNSVTYMNVGTSLEKAIKRVLNAGFKSPIVFLRAKVRSLGTLFYAVLGFM